MITDPEWNMIAKKAFPDKPMKAPAFLWTRILARIESEEVRRGASWWFQWRWMARLTATVGILVGLGTFYLLQHETLPLGIALDGRSNQEQALQLASSDTSTPDDSVAILVGLDS